MVLPANSLFVCGSEGALSLSAFPCFPIKNDPFPDDLPPPLRLQITYDVLPAAAFFALVVVAVGCYMFYAGNKVGVVRCSRSAYLCDLETVRQNPGTAAVNSKIV